MSYLFYLVIGLVVGYVIARVQLRQKNRSSQVVNPVQVKQHQQNLQKILDSLAAGQEITNDKVELILGVSDATAERYLNELEHQGKLVQIGKTGQNVMYKKI